MYRAFVLLRSPSPVLPTTHYTTYHLTNQEKYGRIEVERTFPFDKEECAMIEELKDFLKELEGDENECVILSELIDRANTLRTEEAPSAVPLS